MVRGSCLCGSVRYEVHGKFPRIVHCHCRMCRKAHGAAFGSYGEIRAESFKLVSGEADIASYESSAGVRRTFCRTCGATLQFITAKRPGMVDLAVGTLDDDPGVKPALHIFVGSKAPWFDISDGLPQRSEAS